METDEHQALAGLWDPEVGGIEHHRVNAVLTSAGQVGLDLGKHTHLGHAGDVFHHERSGLEPADEADELAVEAVLGIVDQAGVVPHLREALARRTTGNDVDPLSQVEQLSLDVWPADVAPDRLGLREVPRVGGAGIGIDVGPGDGVPPSLAEAFRDAASTGEEIDEGEPTADPSHPITPRVHPARIYAARTTMWWTADERACRANPGWLRLTTQIIHGFEQASRYRRSGAK